MLVPSWQHKLCSIRLSLCVARGNPHTCWQLHGLPLPLAQRALQYLHLTGHVPILCRLPLAVSLHHHRLHALIGNMLWHLNRHLLHGRSRPQVHGGYRLPCTRALLLLWLRVTPRLRRSMLLLLLPVFLHECLGWRLHLVLLRGYWEDDWLQAGLRL